MTAEADRKSAKAGAPGEEEDGEATAFNLTPSITIGRGESIIVLPQGVKRISNNRSSWQKDSDSQ